MQTSNEASDQRSDDGTVWWIVSKVGSDSETVIQVVIADDGGGSRAKVVAYDIKKLLQKGINAAAFCCIAAINKYAQ